ncbi:MAG: TetR/AcrR family transcriptional regulator [Planctomycetota bacterium]
MTPDSVRDRILGATRELCSEQGFAGLTMRRVAERVGVTAPAIYRHFAGKADLIRAMMDEARELFMSYLVPALKGSTARERFDLAGQRYLAFALEQPRAYEMLFMSANQFGLFGAPSSVNEWRGAPPATFQFCVDRVADCVRDGTFKPGDPNLIALGIAGMSHGMIALWMAGRFGTDEDQFRALFHVALNAHLEGIAA